MGIEAPGGEYLNRFPFYPTSFYSRFLWKNALYLEKKQVFLICCCFNYSIINQLRQILMEYYVMVRVIVYWGHF